MLFFYLVTLCFLFFGLKIKRSGFHEDFLERKQTDAIKGISILMVFIHHALMEVSETGFRPEGLWDVAGYWISSEFGQLIIVMFLFYSGYGVMESVRNKGAEYVEGFPCRRLLTTLLNFDVAVLIFTVLNLLMEVPMTLQKIGWSLIGWQSVGNSNWYIFVILYCYLVTWISCKLFPDCPRKTLAMTSVLVLAGEAALSFLKHGQSWWYNTMLCYPAGMSLSLFKDQALAYVKRYYWPVLGGLLGVFLFLHLQRWIPSLRGLTFNAQSIAFAFLIVIASMKVKTGNRFLYWAGACVFPIYIYQRLPMRALRHWAGEDWVSANPYLFIMLCAVITGVIACLYRYWQIKLKKRPSPVKHGLLRAISNTDKPCAE